MDCFLYEHDCAETALTALQIGAGIQVPPNAARVSRYLGILEAMYEKGNVLESVDLRRFEDGRLLAARPCGEWTMKHYGSPWM